MKHILSLLLILITSSLNAMETQENLNANLIKLLPILSTLKTQCTQYETYLEKVKSDTSDFQSHSLALEHLSNRINDILNNSNLTLNKDALLRDLARKCDNSYALYQNYFKTLLCSYKTSDKEVERICNREAQSDLFEIYKLRFYIEEFLEKYPTDAQIKLYNSLARPQPAYSTVGCPTQTTPTKCADVHHSMVMGSDYCHGLERTSENDKIIAIHWN